MVAHQVASMTRVKDPGNGLGQAVRRVDEARDVDQGDVTGLFPFLNGEVLNVNVARPALTI
jgi:hypothetical protein